MALTTRRLFVAILFVALFVIATREIIDPDFWWHLRTGQYIVDNQVIPHSDVFSATMAGQPWITHEWLSEVLLYVVYSLGSFPALILLFSGLITLSFVLVFASCEGKPYVAAACVLLAAFASAPTWGVRPQIITLLLAAYFLWVLGRKDSTGNRPLLWTFVPLTLLWVNLHSGYALAIVFIGTYLIGEAVGTWHAGERFAGLSSPMGRLALVLVLCIAVVPLNPNGAQMYLYPFGTLGSAAMQTHIQEWFSPDFHQPEFQPFAWMLLGVIGVIAFAQKRPSIAQLILLIGFGYAGLRSARNIPIFALVAAPVLASGLWSIFTTRGWDRTLASGRARSGLVLLNWLLLFLVCVAGAVRIVSVVGSQPTAEQSKFPAAAVSYIAASRQSGTIFNSYVWGGYAIWRLYPQQKVYIDGRADVYGDTFIEDYLRTYRAEDGWSRTMADSQVRWVLVEPNAPLAAELAKQADWSKVYGDAIAVVYEKK